MHKAAGTLIGKSVRMGLKFRRGGGHALPGLVVESIFPKYLPAMLSQLPEGVVVITGTNGKTTTTKIVSQILASQGMKVLTNQTGSNLTRGIVSSLAHSASPGGKLSHDIAVLEVDEATARKLVQQVKPRWVLALNVSRDQLDRFGEIDTIASYIGDTMQAAQQGIICNARDPKLVEQANQAAANGAQLKFFGATEKLAKYFPTDYELAAVKKEQRTSAKAPPSDVQLADFAGQQVTYIIAAKKYRVNLKLTGQHNYLNGAAALALCRALLAGVPAEELIKQLAKVDLAFGRGESYRLRNGAIIELVLVKNPASFSQALASYGSGDDELMIAINDNIADGRDVSWLWDVNFRPLAGRHVALTSGSRAADMALRLGYDDIATSEIEPNLSRAAMMLSQTGGKKIILATYTAMLQLYKLLSKQGQKIS